MDNIVVNTNPKTSIEIVTVGGDLRITGWDQLLFVAETDDEHSLHLDQDGDQLMLRAGSDCTIRLPRGAPVTVRSVGGDARAKSLEQKLTVGQIGGDLVLRQVGGADIAAVGGDLSAKRLAGDLKVGQVSGDLAARGLAGAFEAATIAGDLYLREIEGAIQATAAGDTTLSVDFAPEHGYSISTGGDLNCRLGPDASARLSLSAGGDVSIDLKGAQVEGGANRKTVTLGSGAAAVELRSGGDLTVTGLGFDADAMGDFGEHFGDDFGVMAEEFASQIESQIETQIEAQMADFEKQMADRLAGINYGPGGVNAEEIASKAQRAAERVERAARQQAEAAKRRVEATQRRAEKEAERAQRLAEAAQKRAESIRHKAEAHGRRGWGWGFETSRPPGPPRPAAPSAPASDPVTDEERMVILRMVEQGKISVADAEKLLAALENK